MYQQTLTIITPDFLEPGFPLNFSLWNIILRHIRSSGRRMRRTMLCTTKMFEAITLKLIFLISRRHQLTVSLFFRHSLNLCLKIYKNFRIILVLFLTLNQLLILTLIKSSYRINFTPLSFLLFRFSLLKTMEAATSSNYSSQRRSRVFHQRSYAITV